MDGMEEKLGELLSNPQLMQQIMSMASALSQPQQEPPPGKPPTQSSPALPGLDPGFLQRLSGFAGQARVDPNQKALLSALSPYLSCERMTKLEKAMQAAKMAKLASAFLDRGGLSLLTGR